MINRNKTKLELTWIGKNNPEYDISNIEPRILEEKPELSYGDPNTENMIIHGDNLLALKALLPEYEGKVKCIYIDPPYNTGSAFEHYDDSVEHSTWLSLIRPRLELLKMLLSDDGSIWISVDDHEMHYMKVLMDEIFGRNNFITTIVWQQRTTRENRKTFSSNHEYILLYAREYSLFAASRNSLDLTTEVKARYKNPDNDVRGPWQSVSANAQAGHATPSQFYELIAPNGKRHQLPNGRCWLYTQDRMKDEVAANNIWFGKDGNGVPRVKKFLTDAKQGLTPETFWPAEEVGTNDLAKKHLIELFRGKALFDTPKPESLITRIVHIAANRGDIILDSFLGSGTTAAVAHKMGRRYIGIEMGDHAYTHCKVRLDKVVDGTDQGGISNSVDWKGGGGFKFYELAPSFITKDEFGNPVIDNYYNDTKLIRAMCKLTNYTFAPSQKGYWKHGKGQGKNSIYVTTQLLSVAVVQQIASHLGETETLLICPKKYEPGCEKVDPRITIKKIPQSILKACQFGKKEYLLPIKERSIEEIEEEESLTSPENE